MGDVIQLDGSAGPGSRAAGPARTDVRRSESRGPALPTRAEMVAAMTVSRYGGYRTALFLAGYAQALEDAGVWDAGEAARLQHELAGVLADGETDGTSPQVSER